MPCTGIIDYVEATQKMIDIAISLNNNSKVLFSHEVLKIDNQDGLKAYKN